MADSVAEAICSLRNWAFAIALRAASRSQPLRIAEVCRKSLLGIVSPPKICPEVGYLRNFAATQLNGGNWAIELSKQK